MNKEDLAIRLNILLEQDVIQKEAYDVTIEAFEKLIKVSEKNDIKKEKMIFKQLPTALNRIAKGEGVEGPNEDMLQEVMEHEYYPLAKQQVDELKRSWQKDLPKSEYDYLLLHYTNVISMNKGGKEG